MLREDAAGNRWLRVTRGAVLVAIVALASTARAADPREQAAKAFDEGVAFYDRAAYADAARAFLRADAAVPSTDALSNALAAARRANEQLLVVEIAMRAVQREAKEPALAVKARQALADAAVHLAQVDFDCEPAPCSLELDGKPVERGSRYLLPGTHVLRASAAAGANAQENLNLAAGATYRVLLHATKPGEAARASEVEKKAAPQAAAKPDEKDERPGRSAERPLPPAVFYVGVWLSVALIGVTTWSGLDTLSAKRDLGPKPTTSEVDGVRVKAQRTDLLLAGSVLVSAATVYAGLRLVSFGDERRGARLGVAPQAAFVSGWFP